MESENELKPQEREKRERTVGYTSFLFHIFRTLLARFFFFSSVLLQLLVSMSDLLRETSLELHSKASKTYVSRAS